MSESKNKIEALLFSSGRAIDIEEIANLMNVEKKKVKKSLKELKKFYDSLDSSLMLIDEGNSWKLSIKEKYISLVTKIVADTELGKAVLETLSIIAWKSPVLQSKVIKIRSASAYEHIKELIDKGFVSKEKEGRSYRIRITEKFFQYFDVPGDKGIKEAFKAVDIPAKIEQKKKMGHLEVVSTNNDSKEHGKTAEIFGDHKDEQNLQEQSDSADDEKVIEPEKEEKDEIPPIDEGFLDKINDQISEISKKNDELDDDELFKRKTEESDEEESLDETPVYESSPDESEESETNTEDETKSEEEVSEEKDADSLSVESDDKTDEVLEESEEKDVTSS